MKYIYIFSHLNFSQEWEFDMSCTFKIVFLIVSFSKWILESLPPCIPVEFWLKLFQNFQISLGAIDNFLIPSFPIGDHDDFPFI